MSRSKKDGRRGGAHRTKGDYWSRRARNSFAMSRGRTGKTITHRLERRAVDRDIDKLFRCGPWLFTADELIASVPLAVLEGE